MDTGRMNVLTPPGGFAPPPPVAYVVGAAKDGAPIVVVGPPQSAGQAAAATDVLTALAHMRGIYLAQTVDVLEMLTGWERVNRYKLQPWDPARGGDRTADGILAPPTLKMKEDSGCLCRQFCGASRAFRMALYPYAEGQFPPPNADVFFLPGAVIIERPFRCTPGCLPCLRPVMRVRHASVGYIGEIRQPSCPPLLNYHFNIYSPSRGAGSEDMMPGAPLHVHPLRTGEPPGTHWYTVRGELCQLSMFCFLPFAGCKRIRFPIFEASDVAFTKPVGEITKVWKDCCVSMLVEADSFTITYPQQANEVQRACITAAAILIDFRMFEKPAGDSPGGSALGNILGALA